MSLNMRPGVYSNYTLTPLYAKNKGRAIGIIANPALVFSKPQRVTTIEQAKSLFGQIDEYNWLMQMIYTIFSHSNPVIYVATILDDDLPSFKQALNSLMSIDEVYVIITDNHDAQKHSYFKECLEKGASVKKEKIAVIPSLATISPIVTANTVNCERICLTYPPITLKEYSTDISHAILAAFIAQNTNPASNLNGEFINGDFVIEDSLSEEEINTAISNGICVFEQMGNYTELIRGVTTKTLGDDDEVDYTYRNLSTITLIDSIVPRLRSVLEERLKFLKNSPASLDSLVSLIVCELSDFKDAGLLSSYQTPVVYLSQDDTSILIIDLSFTITQGINQIHLTCHISV